MALNVVYVFPLDSSNSGGVPDGTLARCKAGLRKYRKLKGEKRLILCLAGYCRKNPFAPSPGYPVSLAGEVERFITQWDPSAIIHVKPVTWGTVNEISAMVQWIKNFQAMDPIHTNTDVTVFAVSNKAHLWRIRILWKLLAPPSHWKIVPVVAKHHFGLRSIAWEAPKTIKDAWLIISGRVR